MAITLCQKKGFSLAYVFKNIKSESEMWNVTDIADEVILYLLFILLFSSSALIQGSCSSG